MAVSVVEHISGAAGGFSGTYALSISTTPAAGDYVLLRTTQVRSGVTATSVAGLGASWSKIANSADTDQSVQFWLGTGATASGSATVTFNGFTWATGAVTLVRGLTAATVLNATDLNNDTGTDVGPSLTGKNGQFVSAAGHSSNLTAYAGSSPASGWTTDTVVTAATGITSGQSYRIPSSSASHAATATNSNSTNGRHLIVVLGDEVVPGVEAVTATATAEAHAPTVQYGYTVEAVAATATAAAHAPTVGAAVAPPTTPRRNLARLAVRVGSRHITREVSGLQFRKEAIGGLQSMEFRLSRPLDRFDVDLAHLSKVYIYDARSAATIAEGRLYDFGRSASASDGQQWDIVAFGPAQHASDITRPLIYIDRDLSRWERLTGSKKASRTEVDADGATADDSALLMEFPEGTTLADDDTAMMVYRACEEAGMQIGAVAWTWDAGATTANYEVRLTTGTSGTTLGSNDLTATFDTAGGTMTAWTVDTFPTGRTRVTARIYKVSGGAGAAPADRWATFENVRVLGRRMDKTGTLVSGSAGMTASGRVLISQVVNDIVGRMLPEFDGANASIDTSGAYEIDQLAYPDGATAEQVLDDCMALDPAFRWYAGPDVTGDGYSFTFAPWPTTVRYEVTLEGGGSFPTSAQELFNEVSVRWRTARGKTRSTLVTGACPILDDAGITRRALIDLSDETGSSANATQAGTNFLADHRVPKNAGTLTIRQPIRDLTTGRMVDPFEIEPGELIRVRGIESYADALNASSNDGLTVFRINAMSYSSDENAAQLELDSDARTTSNALRRLAKRRNRKR